jgi:hypothetical protein
MRYDYNIYIFIKYSNLKPSKYLLTLRQKKLQSVLEQMQTHQFLKRIQWLQYLKVC